MKKIKLKDSKFFKKVKELAPDILDAVGTVFPPADKLGEILENVQEDKKEAIKLAHAQDLEAFALEVEDRKDARGLYKIDSVIQKIFALVFLIGYALLSYYLLNIIKGDVKESELFKTMVTMIWTGTSTKLGTIIDFLFGGSVK